MTLYVARDDVLRLVENAVFRKTQDVRVSEHRIRMSVDELVIKAAALPYVEIPIKRNFFLQKVGFRLLTFLTSLTRFTLQQGSR